MIKKLNPDEVESLALLYFKTWQAVYQGITSQAFYAYLTLEQAQIDLAEAIATGELFFGAVIDGEIVGFVSVRENTTDLPDDVWELHRLYVLPDFQGQNLGRALVNTVRDYLKVQQKASRYFLFVVDSNPAKQFYQKLGGEVLFKRQIADAIPEIETAIGFNL